MENIGLVTITYNFGSILQCYATIKYINDLGFNCELLECETNNKNNLYYRFKNRHFKPIFFNCEDYYKDPIFQKNKIDFINKYIKRVFYEYKMLKKVDKSKRYLMFIAGSDQIWKSSHLRNLNNEYVRTKFLYFAKKTPSCSFATSFGSSEVFSYNIKFLKKYLNNINFISVRERFSKNIVQKYCKKSVEELCDPIVLFSKEEWREIYKSKLGQNQDYVLLHFLATPSNDMLKMIKLYRNTNRKKLFFAFYCQKKYFEEIDNIQYINGSPFDYISLIDNAKFIFTDSFHTSQFSLIFKKPFLVSSRTDYGSDQIGRIKDLINKFKCQKNFIDANKETDINEASKFIKYIDSCLSLEKTKLRSFLNNIINNVKI